MVNQDTNKSIPTQAFDFLNLEAIVDNEEEEEEEEEMDSEELGKPIACHTTLDFIILLDFLAEDIKESEAEWPGLSSLKWPSPAVDFAQEASDLHDHLAGQDTQRPRFDTQVVSDLQQNHLVPIDEDPDLWAVHVKVRYKLSPYYRF